MGDGAYDSVKLTNAILNKQPDASIVIPPPSDAVISPEGDTPRDQHIRLLEEVVRKRLINPIFLRHDQLRYASHFT